MARKNTVSFTLSRRQLIAITPSSCWRGWASTPGEEASEWLRAEGPAEYWTEKGAVLNSSHRPLPARFTVHASRKVAEQMLVAASQSCSSAASTIIAAL